MNEEGNREIDLLKLIVEEKRIETDRKFKEAELKLKEQEHRLDKLQIWIPVITIVTSVASTIAISFLTSRTTLKLRGSTHTQIQSDLNKYFNEQQKESAQRRVPKRKLDAEIKDRIENVPGNLEFSMGRVLREEVILPIA